MSYQTNHDKITGKTQIRLLNDGKTPEGRGFNKFLNFSWIYWYFLYFFNFLYVKKNFFQKKLKKNWNSEKAFGKFLTFMMQPTTSLRIKRKPSISLTMYTLWTCVLPTGPDAKSSTTTKIIFQSLKVNFFCNL